jgi:predicted amidophosphoribosyltransferase
MSFAKNLAFVWIKEKISSSTFRVCIRCGGFVFSGTPLYCEFCDANLQRWRLNELQVPSEQKFPVYALYAWTILSDSFVRPLVYALKGGRCREQFGILARDFSFRMNLSESPLVLVVPPRKVRSQQDHALAWARSIARIWQVEVWDCLAYPDGETPDSQKKKSVTSRSEREFCPVKNANLPPQARVVFVDDVLTTGSTARAAFKALGSPKGFEVWAIVWRPKLATQEPF